MTATDEAILTPRSRITHKLKSWPQFFNPTRNGVKQFELRRNDRDYRVGDQLLLKEWSPALLDQYLVLGDDPEVANKKAYTGRELLVRVDYIMDSMTLDRLMNRFQEGAQMSGYIIMSISHVN